jgi:hypothetical protein
MTAPTQPSELGPYRPVSDAMVLAAIDRAERHSTSGHADGGVAWSRVTEHLGFAHTAGTTSKLRRQMSRLKSAGLVASRKAHGYPVWELTNDGRKALAQARRKREDLALPESPQHRRWATARMTATERIEGLYEQLRGSLTEAIDLIDSNRGDSDTWFELHGRLTRESEWVAQATYCLREWPEPADTTADRDDDSSPYSNHRRDHVWGTARVGERGPS